MTWQTDYRVSDIVFHPVGLGAAVTVAGVRSSRIVANSDVRREVATGSIHASTASLQSVSPVATVQIANLVQALTVLGVSGTCIEADPSHPGMYLYAQRQGCTGPEAGAVHRRYQIREGVLVPTQLTVDHRGDALMTYDLNARYDGTNDPVLVVDGESLPASAGADARWTMDRMMGSVGGGTPVITEIEGKRNISIDFGAQVTSEGADSDPYDSVQSLSQMLSTVTVRGVDLAWFDGVVPLLGTSRTLTDFITIYLKNRDELHAATEHVALTIRGLLTQDTIIDGSPDSPAETSFAMHLVNDGTNAPIIVQTGIAIPLP